MYICIVVKHPTVAATVANDSPKWLIETAMKRKSAQKERKTEIRITMSVIVML